MYTIEMMKRDSDRCLKNYRMRKRLNNSRLYWSVLFTLAASAAILETIMAHRHGVVSALLTTGAFVGISSITIS